MRIPAIVLMLSLTACAWISTEDFKNQQDRDGDQYISEQFGGDDCDDNDPEIHPDADDTPYDGIDQDCDDSPEYDQDRDGERAYAYGGIDCDDNDPDVIDDVFWYPDEDKDGYGDQEAAVKQCIGPPGYIRLGDDCDDTREDVRPGATEACDGVDNNCDGIVDPENSANATAFFPDEDGDGYGSDDETSWRYTCELPTDRAFPYLTRAGDCNDALDWVNPDIEVEICNDFEDNNCDGKPGTCELSGFGYINPNLIWGTGMVQSIANAVILPEPYLSPIRYNGQLGSWVGGVGDLNGDERDDLLITAPFIDNTDATAAGQVFFFRGRTKAEDGLTLNTTNRWEFGKDARTLTIADSDLTLEGTTEHGLMGENAHALGDINGDAYDDLAISQCGPSDDIVEGGKVFIYPGSPSFFDAPPTPWTLTGLAGPNTIITPDAHCAIANWTYDSRAYLAVSAPHYDASEGGSGRFNPSRGLVYILSGALEDMADDNQEIDVREQSIIIEPPTAGSLSTSYLGTQVATGDFDGDGEADLFISNSEGLERSGAQIGTVHVAYAADKLIASASAGDIISVSDFDAAFTGNRPQSYAGTAVAAGADMDHDGRDDLIIGAPGFDGNRGAVYVIYSSESTYRGPWFLDLAGVRLDGSNVGDFVGTSVTVIPGADPVKGYFGLDGDKYPDIWIGSGGPPDTEATYLVSAQDIVGNDRLNSVAHGTFYLGQNTYSYPPEGARYTGRAVVASAGDINGDGYVDVTAGFPWRDPRAEATEREGIVAIFLGGGF